MGIPVWNHVDRCPLKGPHYRSWAVVPIVWGPRRLDAPRRIHCASRVQPPHDASARNSRHHTHSAVLAPPPQRADSGLDLQQRYLNTSGPRHHAALAQWQYGSGSGGPYAEFVLKAKAGSVGRFFWCGRLGGLFISCTHTCMGPKPVLAHLWDSRRLAPGVRASRGRLRGKEPTRLRR